MHEGKWLKGCICIDNNLDKNRHIHEAKHINMYKMGIQVKCMNHQN